MHEFNIKFFTLIGKANNNNGETTYIKFFSGNLSIFDPRYAIDTVYTASPVQNTMMKALLELGFYPAQILFSQVIWRLK